MRPERTFRPLAARVADLNARLGAAPAGEILRETLTDPAFGRVALVSSFGAESVALLHLVAQVDRSVPVLFLETGRLFPETLAYRREVAGMLGLTDLRVIRPDPAGLRRLDPAGALHAADPDACCALRKAAPLARALEAFDTWITGRKRAQGATRAALSVFEEEAGTGRVKVNPLARWRSAEVRAHIAAHGLPRHPLVARGYPSIGCAPCTSPVVDGEDPRAGRWRGSAKTECGIHLGGGGALRAASEGES